MVINTLLIIISFPSETTEATDNILVAVGGFRLAFGFSTVFGFVESNSAPKRSSQVSKFVKFCKVLPLKLDNRNKLT